jgi:hypothetical protein
VRVIECGGHGSDNGAHVPYGHPGRVAVFDQLRGVGAVDVVHGDPELTIELAAIMHRDDVRVPQRSGQVGFALKPLTKVAVRCYRFGEDFQSILARQPGMPSKVDLGHPAGTQRPHDGVPVKGHPNR